HYIGMKDLSTDEFTEFKWMRFVIGMPGLFFLRTAVLGKARHLVDGPVLYFYFGLFSLWSFAYKMYWYGHHLSPTASVKVDPFTPPLFGYKKLANFEVYSYPAFGSYALAGVALLLALAFYLAWRPSRGGPAWESHAPGRALAALHRRPRGGGARDGARAARGPRIASGYLVPATSRGCRRARR